MLVTTPDPTSPAPRGPADPPAADRWQKPVLLAVCLLWVAYAWLYISRTSFVIGGTRYFTLFDDAMISMTYARNLAHGYGLVWNPGGERIEGYTNLLWTLWMAALHLTRVPPEKMSLLVQISAAALLALNLALVWRLARRLSGSQTVALVATGLVAFYQPLNMWSLQGMEVAVLAPLVTGCLLLGTGLIGASQPTTARILAMYCLLGLGTLVRPDAAVVMGVFALFFIATDAAHRRTHMWCFAAAALVFIGGQTLFRILYYGEVLPNTYYLKMTGFPAIFRASRGLIVIVVAIWNFNWLLCSVPFVLLLRQPQRQIQLLFALVLTQAAYSVYVGGDAWESTGGTNRYLVIVMPAFLILLTMALRQLALCLRDWWGETHRLPARGLSALAVLVLLVIVVDLNLPSRLLRGQELPMITPMLLTPTLCHEANRENVEMALRLRAATDPEATVGLLWAGAIPYFSQRPAVDLLGKSDRYIAHLSVTPKGRFARLWAFYPGHTKWDTAYTLQTQRPDIIPELWPAMVTAGGDRLRREYAETKIGKATVRWRRDSTRVHPQALLPGASAP